MQEYKTKKALAEQSHEVILAHILDPENSPLPEELKVKFNRVISASKLLDDFHPSSVIPRLQAKYNITRNCAREDIRLAQDLFKSQHQFDFDFWQQWQIKDLVETIHRCKQNGKEKERIQAHKVLRDVIGEKQVSPEDPKRMEKNIFYVQLNNNGTTVNIDFDKLKNLSPDEIRTVVQALTTPVTTDENIIEILNT